MSATGPVLRIFEVKTKPGCREQLLANFASASVEVVRGKPGNQGYFFGSFVEERDDAVMFVSIWETLEAVKARFGDSWQESYLPEGYEELISECSIRHLNASDGWEVDA